MLIGIEKSLIRRSGLSSLHNFRSRAILCLGFGLNLVN
jgi:hypothetical protein